MACPAGATSLATGTASARHNIHVYQSGDPEIERHLAFCAFLRADAAVCREYEALKREAYARHPADIAAYCDHKDAWISAWRVWR